MKLKYIELYGFKSFAEKTKIVVNENISAIVGPNGSGKSNISDAIKWVLGEQSIKSLRGSKMEDVIFSGTDSRKPLNMAQVSLILDNSDKSLPISFDEVNITRRVFRTGDSEYLINKSLVRLKDIKELFLDTGIGKDGYSMIGQGRIDEILNGRNEDRRYIFEEASGISKNKYKKNEAEKKLIRNEENLGILKNELKIKQQEADILKIQSENAKEGIKLTSRLELLELNLLNKSIKKFNEEFSKNQSDLKYIQESLDKNVDRYNKIDNLIKPIQMEIDDLELFINKEKENNIENIKSIQKYESNIKIYEEKTKFYKADIDRLNNEINYKKTKINKENQELTRIEKEIISFKDKKSIIDETILNKTKTNQDLLELINQNTIYLKELNEKIKNDEEILSSMKINKTAKEKIDINNNKLRDDYINEIKKIKNTLDEKDSILNAKKLEIKDIDDILEKNSNKIILYKEEKINQSVKIDKLKNLVEKNRSDYLILKSKRDLLFSQYKSYEGYYKSVQNLLKVSDKNLEIKNKIYGVLADLIQVDRQYEIAVDVALGGALQNIVVKDEEDGKYLIKYIKNNNIGRITFLPISKINGYKNMVKHPKAIDTLNNLIKYDTKIENIINYFLSKTILVKNMDDAVIVSKDLSGYRIITLDGEIINSWGSMVGGNTFKKESNSLLNRKNELDKIELKLKEIEDNSKSYLKNIEIENKILEDIKFNINALENKNEDFRYQFNNLNSQISELNIQKSFISEKIKEYEINIEKIDEELNTSDFSNIDVISIDLDELKLKYSNKKIILDKLSEENLILEKDLIKLKSDRDVIYRDYSLLTNNLENKKNDLEDLTKSLNNDKDILSITMIEVEKANQNIENYKLENTKVTNNLKSVEKTLKEKSEELSEKKEKIKRDSLELEELKKSISEFEKEKYKLEFKIEGIEEKEKNLKIDYMETYSITENELDDKLNNVEYIDATRKEIVEVKNRLSEIGYFNYDSIESYRVISEDLDFMNSQIEDLIITRDDIKNMISDIESEMKKMFKSSFEEINIKFNKIFNILFDGGEAELKLDSDDLLTAGIEIIARPPGKKLKNLSLLSGGEKALTAVALLFAIFEINPAPFCLLDEIDAALDEANIKRYINYLKSLVDKTQFIIITHRKATMEMADILYGVTMEEQGVSKVITLALDSYNE